MLFHFHETEMIILVFCFFLPLCQSPCQPFCNILLSLNIQVSINISGHFDVGMTQPFLYVFKAKTAA